jgi:hypothetical protein
LPAGRVFPAAVKLKGTLTVEAALAELVANVIEAIADAKMTF